MRLVLGQNRILETVSDLSSYFLILPSRHLRSEQLALLLRRNGLSCKPLGRGSGLLLKAGREIQVKDLLVISIPRKQEKAFHRYLRLFGSKAVAMPESNHAAG